MRGCISCQLPVMYVGRMKKIYTVTMIDLRDNVFNFELKPLGAFTDKEHAKQFAEACFGATGDECFGHLSADEKCQSEVEKSIKNATLGEGNKYIITGENLIIYVSEMTLIDRWLQ